MKKSLRIIAGVAATMMMALSLSACSPAKDEPTKGTSSNAPNAGADANAPALASQWKEFSSPRKITISWMEQGWTGMDKDLDIITPEIASRTNLTLGYEPITLTNDDYTQKLNLMVAANEVPDVFFGNADNYTRSIYDKLGKNSEIWDLTEIIKEYKNLYELVTPELNLYKTADTGSNYFIPTQTGRGNNLLNDPPHGTFYRTDYLDKLKLDFPRTPEEIAEYMRRCKAEIKFEGKEVNGFILGENLAGIESLYNPFFPLLGDRDSVGLPFDYTDNFKVKNYEYTNSPELMQAAKFIHGMMAEGLIDKEALIIKTAQAQEKIASGATAACASTWWDINAYSDTAKAIVPELMFVAPPPVYANEQVKKVRSREWTNWVGCYSSLIVSKKIDEPTLRHLLATMDYLATADGQMLVQAGIEGKTYEYGEDGKYKYTDKFIADTNNLDWNKCAAYGVSYYAQLVYNIPAIVEKQAASANLLREDNKLGWENQAETRALYSADMTPPKDYYFIPGEVENEKFPAIKDRKNEFWARVLSAKSEADVESIVNEWGKTCTSMGINDIINERQAYIDNFDVTK